MIETVRSWYSRARESLFFVPAVAVVFAIAGARLTVWLDSRFQDAFESVPAVVSVTVPSARSVLSTVAGATITVAGIVFAMTAVTVQLASSQYSPRVVYTMQRDRFQQAVIAVVAATFVFSLLVLATIRTDIVAPADTATSKSLSVTLSIALGVLSIISIVAFIDHTIRRVRIDQTIRRIAASTRQAVARLHPEKPEVGELGASDLPEGSAFDVLARRTGWVRGIHMQALVSHIPERTVVRLDALTGAHVDDGATLASVWTEQPDGVGDIIRSAYRIGSSQAVDEDPEYGLRILVDIALRALSPGINDPTTAVHVIEHMAGPLREILHRALPPRVLNGPEGRSVFRPGQLTHNGYVRRALTEIRLSAGEQPVVVAAILHLTGDLVEDMRRRDLDARSGALLEEARLALEGASALPELDYRRLVEVAEHLRLSGDQTTVRRDTVD